MSTSVAIAGVLSVWSSRELASAVAKDRNRGTHRPSASSASARAIAAGDASANHRPPSDANDFCGAK